MKSIISMEKILEQAEVLSYQTDKNFKKIEKLLKSANHNLSKQKTGRGLLATKKKILLLIFIGCKNQIQIIRIDSSCNTLKLYNSIKSPLLFSIKNIIEAF